MEELKLDTWKLALLIFTIVFSYRLFKNLSCWIRTSHYLDQIKSKYAIPLNLQPSINKLINQTLHYNLSYDKDGLTKAKAVFGLRIKENFSLFYWLESIFFLPSKLFSYFGFNHRKKHDFIEYLFSIVGWCICFVIGLFSNEIKDILINFF